MPSVHLDCGVSWVQVLPRAAVLRWHILLLSEVKVCVYFERFAKCWHLCTHKMEEKLIDVWRSKQVTTIHKTIRENRTQVAVGVPFVSSLKNTKKNVWWPCCSVNAGRRKKEELAEAWPVSCVYPVNEILTTEEIYVQSLEQLLTVYVIYIPNVCCAHCLLLKKLNAIGYLL